MATYWLRQATITCEYEPPRTRHPAPPPAPPPLFPLEPIKIPAKHSRQFRKTLAVIPHCALAVKINTYNLLFVQIVATDPSLIMEDISKPRRASSTCAWVNIIYGCNEHCTYCVVPGVRGVEQSRPMESIRQEMVELAAAGYREVSGA